MEGLRKHVYFVDSVYCINSQTIRTVTINIICFQKLAAIQSACWVEKKTIKNILVYYIEITLKHIGLLY